MKERLEDFKLLLKNDRRIWAVAGFIVVIIFLGTFASKEKRQRPQIDMSASSVQNQGMGMAESARFATAVHAAAGDLAAGEEGGERGLLAGDLLGPIHRLMNPRTEY